MVEKDRRFFISSLWVQFKNKLGIIFLQVESLKRLLIK